MERNTEYITTNNIKIASAEAEQFIKQPMFLFTNEKYRHLSIHAKVLYGFLLDRTGLSLLNKERFTDKDGRAFIFFSYEEVMLLLDCGREKTAKTFAQLKEYDLIERQSSGCGKKKKIYVKRLQLELIEKTDCKTEKKHVDSSKSLCS